MIDGLAPTGVVGHIIESEFDLVAEEWLPDWHPFDRIYLAELLRERVERRLGFRGEAGRALFHD